MQAQLNGETRPVIRNRRSVVWCPFCDTSSVLAEDLVRCASCFAVFSEEAAQVAVPEESRRRRRASEEQVAEAEEPGNDSTP